ILVLLKFLPFTKESIFIYYIRILKQRKISIKPKRREIMNILRAPEGLAKRVEFEPLNSPYRSDFMRDRDRIMYSNSFRRLDGKTQIYLTGENDHRRNRLTHTLEVAQIARTISQGLELNLDLTEAIALGHDLGHTPF